MAVPQATFHDEVNPSRDSVNTLPILLCPKLSSPVIDTHSLTLRKNIRFGESLGIESATDPELDMLLKKPICTITSQKSLLYLYTSTGLHRTQTALSALCEVACSRLAD